MGKRSLGKGKGSPWKKKAKATKKTRDTDSDDNDSYYDDEKEPTLIYDMNRRELITKIKELEKTIRDLKMKLENQTETGRRSLKNTSLDHDWNAEETMFVDVVGHFASISSSDSTSSSKLDGTVSARRTQQPVVID